MSTQCPEKDSREIKTTSSFYKVTASIKNNCADSFKSLLKEQTAKTIKKPVFYFSMTASISTTVID